MQVLHFIAGEFIAASATYSLRRIAARRNELHWKLLLTGWSLVRIRPGEPVVIDISILFAAVANLPTTLPQA